MCVKIGMPDTHIAVVRFYSINEKLISHKNVFQYVNGTSDRKKVPLLSFILLHCVKNKCTCAVRKKHVRHGKVYSYVCGHANGHHQSETAQRRQLSIKQSHQVYCLSNILGRH